MHHFHDHIIFIRFIIFLVCIFHYLFHNEIFLLFFSPPISFFIIFIISVSNYFNHIISLELYFIIFFNIDCFDFFRHFKIKNVITIKSIKHLCKKHHCIVIHRVLVGVLPQKHMHRHYTKLFQPIKHRNLAGQALPFCHHPPENRSTTPSVAPRCCPGRPFQSLAFNLCFP